MLACARDRFVGVLLLHAVVARWQWCEYQPSPIGRGRYWLRWPPKIGLLLRRPWHVGCVVGSGALRPVVRRTARDGDCRQRLTAVCAANRGFVLRSPWLLVLVGGG